MVVYGLGWGWVGLVMYSVVRLHPDIPAAATGVAATGLAVGAALGPLATGQVIEATSHAVGWMVAASASVMAAVSVLVARIGFLRRQLAGPSTPVPSTPAS